MTIDETELNEAEAALTHVKTPPRSALRSQLSEIVHRINESGADISVSSALTSPHHERFSGARMYDHTDTSKLHQARQMMGGLPGETPGAPSQPQPGAEPQWVRTRPRPGSPAMPMARPVGIGVTGGLAALGGGSASGMPSLPAGPRPPVLPGSLPPQLALGPGPTPAQTNRRTSRADRANPGKKAMTTALSHSLGDTVPPADERPWWTR